jgi:hypothetical protein
LRALRLQASTHKNKPLTAKFAKKSRKDRKEGHRGYIFISQSLSSRFPVTGSSVVAMPFTSNFLPHISVRQTPA